MRTRIGVAAFALSFCVGGALNAQQKTQNTAAREGRGAIGADANIKSTADQNSKGTVIPAPPDKGGARTRGDSWCWVRVNNKTSLYAKVYIDGTYRGEMPPWGDLGVWIECGRTKLYARADFTDGTYRYWGPWDIYMNTNWTWTVSP